MRVRLLKDIYEGATFDETGKQLSQGSLKTIAKPAQLRTGIGGEAVVDRPATVLQFRENAELEMSDSSGQKYIEKGLAERV